MPSIPVSFTRLRSEVSGFGKFCDQFSQVIKPERVGSLRLVASGAEVWASWDRDTCRRHPTWRQPSDGSALNLWGLPRLLGVSIRNELQDIRLMTELVSGQRLRRGLHVFGRYVFQGGGKGKFLLRQTSTWSDFAATSFADGPEIEFTSSSPKSFHWPLG